MVMGGYLTWGDDLAVGDFNGDGYDDAAVSEDYALQFHVYDGSASGLTALSSTVSYTASYRFSERLRAADFDGDGYDDLLAIGRDYLDPTHMLLFPGSASGLSATPSWVSYSGVAGGVEEPHTGDVNGDGAPDAIIFEAGTKLLPAVTCLRGGAAGV